MRRGEGTARFDPGVPSDARMWNLWLGGTDYGSSEARKAAEVEETCPQMRQMVVNARLFSARTVAWAASEGTAQFLDLGCGLPPGPAIHDVARSVRPGSRVAYVDRDYGVTDELPALLGFPDQAVTHDGLAVVNADVRHPGRLLARRDVRAVIDPGRPACALLGGVLYALPPGQAARVIAGYAGRLAPGSVIAVTVPAIPDGPMRDGLARAHLPAARYDTTPARFAAWFAGLELVPPGIAPAKFLRPGWRDVPPCPGGEPYVLAGIGRVR